MLRIQRVNRDIGRSRNDNCEISYMQGRKFPNAGEIVEPISGVSNKNILKNPYNTLNEPVAQSGNRPWMVTTDKFGNVFAKTEVKEVQGVTNNNILKNPYNILEMPVPEKRTLTLQRIKDINNKSLPDYVTENRGINEVMLQVVAMITDKPVKLITIHLLKILITKNAKEHGYQTQQNILKALNAFDQVMTMGRRIFKENTLSPTRIPEMMRPYVDQYQAAIRRIYGNMDGKFAKIDVDIQAGLTELGLLSNGLSRMFEYQNSVDPSNTLSREQIESAALSTPNLVPRPHGQENAGDPPDDAKDIDDASQVAQQGNVPQQFNPVALSPVQILSSLFQQNPDPFSQDKLAFLFMDPVNEDIMKEVEQRAKSTLSLTDFILQALIRLYQKREINPSDPSALHTQHIVQKNILTNTARFNKELPILKQIGAGVVIGLINNMKTFILPPDVVLPTAPPAVAPAAPAAPVAPAAPPPIPARPAPAAPPVAVPQGPPPIPARPPTQAAPAPQQQSVIAQQAQAKQQAAQQAEQKDKDDAYQKALLAQQALAAQQAGPQQAGPLPKATLTVNQYKALNPEQRSRAFDSYIQNLKDRDIHKTISKDDIRLYITTDYPAEPKPSTKFKKDSLFKIAFTLGLDSNKTPEDVITRIYNIPGL